MPSQIAPIAQIDLRTGQRVRYKPGFGTYGYEDAIASSPDGRVPGVVVGFSKKRVRVAMLIASGGIMMTRIRAVDPKTLVSDSVIQNPCLSR